MRRWWQLVILLALAVGLGGLVWNGLAVVLTLVAESAPYLLIGFLLAGLLKAVVPEHKVYRHLGRDDFPSVARASLLGIPIPLCSCSVLPVAMSLRRSGASKGATTSFLISTPETGLDSIGITYALLDPIMTVARPLAAFATALVTGSLVNVVVRPGWDRGPELASVDDRHDHQHLHDHDAGWSSAVSGSKDVRSIVREATTFAFGPLLDDLTPWFIIGFVISGLIVFAMPDDFFGALIPTGWASSLLMLLIGTPIYICAAAATPVAVTLLAKGLDPGAALVLLLVGPATNVTTMLVIARLLGRRILAIHLLGVTGCALILGALLNHVYFLLGVDLSVIAANVIQKGISPVTMAATALLLYFLIRSAIRIRLLAQWTEQLRALCTPLGFDPLSTASRLTLLAMIAVAYLYTAVSVIGPGEVGWVVRFGRIVETLSEPGIVVHLPWPLERVTRLRTQEVRSVELGFSRQEQVPATGYATQRAGTTDWPPAASMRRDLAAEAEVMTGEENLLSLTYAVHFDVANAYAYRYRVADALEVVRPFAAWALRQAVAQRSSSEILVTHRDAIERDSLAILQTELDALGSGVRVRAVTLQDVHASPQVHAAFRDVASALEDKEQKTRQAEGYRSEALALARADAFSLSQEAASYQSETVQGAAGKASAFLARLAAYRQHPRLTQLRLFFETMEEALGNAQTTFLLGEDVEMALWNVRDNDTDSSKNVIENPVGDTQPRPKRRPATGLVPFRP